MIPESTERFIRRLIPNFEGFRDVQKEAIEATVNGINTLCIMPTGSGKSLIYQTAGAMLGGLTVVISPLVALMGQQAEKLRTAGINALSFSDIPSGKGAEKLRNLPVNNEPCFLFISPERAASDGYIEYFLRRNASSVGLIVIDEAHCVSQWGYTFRPSYAALPRFFNRVFGESWPPLVALTATISQSDRDEILRSFKIPQVLKNRDVLRNNLVLKTETFDNEDSKKKRLIEVLEEHRGSKTIVYVHRKTSKKYGTRAMSEEFSASGFMCTFFDGDMDTTARMDVLNNFVHGNTNVVFATSAFGMGIDIPDIRVVVHFLLPESVEQYYQEVGRAGRDGAPAYGYLLYTPTNAKVRVDLINDSLPDKEQVQCLFQKVKPRKGNTGSIHAWNDFSEEKAEGIIWESLCSKGIVKIVGKGPDRLVYFQPEKGTSNPEFERYLGVSPAGLLLAIASRMDISIDTVIGDIFTAYHEKRLKAVRVPEQRIFFEIADELPDAILEEISDEMKKRLHYRLDNFSKLKNMIETKQKPEEAVLALFGSH